MAATTKAKPKAKTATTKARRSTTPKKAAAKPKAISKSPPKKSSPKKSPPKKSPPKKASPKKPKTTAKVAKPTKAKATSKTSTATCATTKMKLRSADPPVHRPFIHGKQYQETFAERPENRAKNPGLLTSPEYIAAVAELKAARREEYDARHAPDFSLSGSAEEVAHLTRRAHAQVRGMQAHHALSILVGSIPADSVITYC
ncbi:hypothetical protein LTS02_000896 [Friedmanniomyces endolithicus]|nr:hypothetical protein LTS02_000896 [Friedmanniomyces endolithicus]KAK0885844.1 hypothetical protein LTR87_000548 [Friedmanniomyces endolithicus]